MKKYYLPLLALVCTVACAAPGASPIGPTAITLQPRPITPTIIRTSYGPDLFSGGSTQIHVRIYGYDEHEVLQPVPDQHVAFSSNAGRLLVLMGRTSTGGEAAALLEIDRATEYYNVQVAVSSGTLSSTLTVPVCACLPSPAPPPVVVPKEK